MCTRVAGFQIPVHGAQGYCLHACEARRLRSTNRLMSWRHTNLAPHPRSRRTGSSAVLHRPGALQFWGPPPLRINDIVLQKQCTCFRACAHLGIADWPESCLPKMGIVFRPTANYGDLFSSALRPCSVRASYSTLQVASPAYRNAVCNRLPNMGALLPSIADAVHRWQPAR